MKDPSEFPAGVITLKAWSMMPDGSTYMHLWANTWRIVTNQATGIEHFRSVERWHACVYGEDGRLLLCIPGCQVQSFAACEKDPSTKGGPQCYVAGSHKLGGAA